jgi:membrane protein DedA with SNARE-associated domain
MVRPSAPGGLILAGLIDRILSLPTGLVLALVFLVPALEASAFLGFVFPGELAVILGGVAAWEGRAPLWAVIVAAVVGAIIGDSIGYLIGRRWGERLLRGSIGRLPFVRERIDRHLSAAQDYVRRRSGRAVFFGRFTTALRVLVPGMAGMSEVPYGSFLVYNVAGGLLWGTGFAILGFLAGASYHRVEKIAGRVGFGLLFLIVVALGTVRLVRRLRSGAPPLGEPLRWLKATRPVAWAIRRYPNQIRWLAARLDPRTPRGFALTFSLAVAAMSAWAFGGVAQDVVSHDELALVDPRFTRWVVAHRTGWLTGVMKAVTWLGSNVVVIPLAAALILYLLLRRSDVRSSLMVGSAVAGAIALYDTIKPVVVRARPPSSIWIGHFSGFAFPSGHATQSVAFYAMVAFVLTSGRSFRWRFALWCAAALIALLVGASRVYLGAHWLTDVLGGYALGATWVALVVSVSLLAGPPEHQTSPAQAL